ncbi:MAG: MarR family transcriptional regulator [Desulfobulbaceae bacterium]|nr:MarR family transcriptional regulator [Desulfobulbaceae bacterium]
MTNPTHKTDRVDRLALSTFTKLVRAAETVTADVHGELSDSGLSVSQFGVLEALFHLGAMCQKDIAQKILKSAGNITMVIDNLEKRGLVKRIRNEKDRRYFDIHLTDEGRGLITKIFPRHAERIRQKMAVLSESEQHMLGDLLRKFKNC